MKSIGVACIFVALCGMCMGSGLPKEAFNTLWTYNETFAHEKDLKGPAEWGESWSMCATAGDHTVQSPIDIDTGSVVVSQSGVLPLEFSGNSSTVTGENTGASLSFLPESGGGFKTFSGRRYKLREAHIHWDKYDDFNGTEHLVDGKGLAAEVHLVHYDAAFPSQDEAIHDGGIGNIAVVAVRYVVASSEKDKTTVPAFDIFKDLQYANPNITPKHENFNLYDLFGNDIDLNDVPMFHYNGSLTTPTCNPIVSWFVVQKHVVISQQQMAALRQCLHMTKEQFDEGIIVDSNVRPACPVNNRVIVAWPKIIDNPVDDPDTASTTVIRSVLVASAAIIFSLFVVRYLL